MRVPRTIHLAGVLCLAASLTAAGTAQSAMADAASAAPCPAGPTGNTADAGVTVSFSTAKRETGGSDAPLKSGFVFQVVDVTLRNRGKFTYKYNALDFVLLDSGAHGYQENGAYDSNLAQPLNMGSLSPGQTLAGQLAFIVPAKLTPAAISWQPSGLGLGQPGGAKLDTNPRNIRLPGYKGGAAQCPAGPRGSTTLDGVTLTVGTAKAGGHGDALGPGLVFQALHVTLRDTGKYSYEYNPNDFIALDAGANEYPQVTAYDDDLAQPIDMGTLHRGQTVGGDLAFAVPRGVTIVAIRWIPTGLGLQQNAGLDVSNQIVRLLR